MMFLTCFSSHVIIHLIEGRYLADVCLEWPGDAGLTRRKYSSTWEHSGSGITLVLGAPLGSEHGPSVTHSFSSPFQACCLRPACGRLESLSRPCSGLRGSDWGKSFSWSRPLTVVTGTESSCVWRIPEILKMAQVCEQPIQSLWSSHQDHRPFTEVRD